MPEVKPVQTYATETPKELSLEVNVQSSQFASQPWEDKLVFSNILPNGSVVKGAKYQDLIPLVPQDYATRFGSFILTAAENRYAGFITLLFSKDKTSTVLNDPNNPNTPVRTNAETKAGHYWHPILRRLDFVPTTFPYTQVNFTGAGLQVVQQAARYVIRQRYIPGTSEGTRFVTSIFQSSTPFQIPQWESPVPTEVSFHYVNLSGSFPSCLHKKLTLQKLLGTIGYVDSGGLTATPDEIKGQTFPATNFTGWEEYVLDDSQKLVNGVWVRTQIKVIPPDEPPEITEIG